MRRIADSHEDTSRLKALHQEQKRVSFHYRPLALVFYLLYGSIFIGLGLWPLGLLYLGTLAVMEWRYWLVQRTNLDSRALLLWAWSVFFLQSLISVIMVGPHAGFQFYLLASLAQAFSSPNTSLRYKNVYGVVITLFFIACDTWISNEDALYQLSPDSLHILLILNIIGISVVLAWTAHARAMSVRDAQKQLEKIASTDPLTGAMNRRAVQQAMERELALSERANQPLSLILCDIDHFK